ncbi:sugar phosphate isomerase/epimerase family protein [Lutibacter citreus]|uniref:sugar phosphate isomerase/epimerase family protein n=1 Tax=Lutibacter citreus TaxID=2138210 RepID=UPI000DBEA138|nr:TIM barrel protein [Lutibacter citreus]
MNRRNFLSKTGQASAALAILGLYGCKASNKTSSYSESKKQLFFKISLAQWSLHRALSKKELDNLDFASKSRNFGCEGLEYVNGFFKDKAKDFSYLKEMNSRANSEGQKNVLIMIDGEGSLADSNTKNRLDSIENHYKWIEAAHFLGCHAIRVNLAGGIDKKDAAKASIDSLTKLSEFAKGSNINVLVENHGGFSSKGTWMTEVFNKIKNENCGTLPDFGNFCIEKNKNKECIEDYDRYKGIKELLPFAKAVSAKSYNFDSNGNETLIDYYKVMKMVKESNYNGFVGIEFEGNNVSEEKGIELTRDLLIKVGNQLS